MNEALQLWCRRAGVLLGAGVLSAARLADQGPKWTYVEGGYSRIDFDDLDADGDLVGQAAWVRVEVGPFEENGVGLFGGVRAMLSPQFELNGGMGYVDIDDSDETSLDLGMVYNVTDMFAVSAGASIGDESTSYGIGLRLYFR
ncbi:MAG: hypothetical protein KF911_03925 [Pseudomonadales bacterium]|nr:hypothetical protein [Pseudomonadales bacterium]